MRRRCARPPRTPSSGFTLVEVVIAVVVLEVAVVGAVGAILLASSTLSKAEQLERATALSEGILDSLGRSPAPGPGRAVYGAGEVLWRVDSAAWVRASALDATGDTLFSLVTILPPLVP